MSHSIHMLNIQIYTQNFELVFNISSTTSSTTNQQQQLNNNINSKTTSTQKQHQLKNNINNILCKPRKKDFFLDSVRLLDTLDPLNIW